MSKPLIGLKIAVVQPKKKRTTTGITRVGRVCEGNVFIDEDGTYKVSISMENDPNYPDLLVLEFTERSYDLTGKQVVFGLKKDNGRIVRYIRSKEHAKFFPGLPTQYIPFAPGYIVKGYLARDNGILKFDFTEVIGNKSLILAENEYNIS